MVTNMEGITSDSAPHRAATVEPAKGLARLERLENGVALVHLGAPDERVVTFTVDRMNSLAEIVATLKRETPRGVVFLGPSAEMFTAGADITLIRDVTDAKVAEQLARRGQSIFDQIEQLRCITVAGISGPCVGGGCEMVLACTYRLITDHAASTIGLPEVRLGILPGFGGTQRLPRLIGLPQALDIILAGKTVRPKQALSRGLVDDIVPYDQLRTRAVKVALGEVVPRRRAPRLLDKILTFNGFARHFATQKARQAVERESKGFYPAPPAALNAVLYGLSHGMQAGLAYEAGELGRLIVTPESKSLVRLFFLTENSKAIGKTARKSIESLQAVVVGAGTMGAGIAGSLARNECSVILKDTSEEILSRGVNQIRTWLSKMSYLSETERSFILNRIETTTRDSTNIGNASLAIEAIFEDLQVKKKVLGDLSKFLPPDAIIASNTSSLSITELARAIEHPERVVGMHFFNPVEKMPLVEIIRGDRTSDKTIAIVAALSTKLGKFPIVVKDVPGFLVNRVLCPYLAEAAYLLQDGYTVKDIDRAALKFGMPMGPLRLLDEVGLDVAAHVAEIMLHGYGDRMVGPGYAKTLLDRGRKGKKNGAGFYDYEGKVSKPHPHLRTLLGISNPEISAPNIDELTGRLIMRLVNESVLCLDEGVAGTPSADAASQVDLGSVMGIGFPPFRGGVLYYANSLGARALHERLLKLEQSYGPRFKPSPGITLRAERGSAFDSAV